VIQLVNIYSRINSLEKKLDAIKITGLPFFFKSEKEYSNALKKRLIDEDDICIIEDVPLDD
jgi:hypothetical protein